MKKHTTVSNVRNVIKNLVVLGTIMQLINSIVIKNNKVLDGEQQMKRKKNGLEELENEMMVMERDDVELMESFKEWMDGECPEGLTLMKVEIDDEEVIFHLQRDKAKDYSELDVDNVDNIISTLDVGE